MDFCGYLPATYQSWSLGSLEVGGTVPTLVVLSVFSARLVRQKFDLSSLSPSAHPRSRPERAANVSLERLFGGSLTYHAFFCHQEFIMNISQPVSSSVESVEFSFLSADEIRAISVRRIENDNTFDSLLNPVPGGLYDPALGSWGDAL